MKYQHMKTILLLLLSFIVFAVHHNAQAETKYITITAPDVQQSPNLLNALREKLKKDGFSFESADGVADNSFSNCDENTLVKIVGKGTKNYFARSKKPVKKTRIYPDFHLAVYKFSNKMMADENFNTIKKALDSNNRFCNGKDPIKLLQRGNTIYYLTARAEMFRTEIETYGNFISNFQE
jgi:hypothetical protein